MSTFRPILETCWLMLHFFLLFGSSNSLGTTMKKLKWTLIVEMKWQVRLSHVHVCLSFVKRNDWEHVKTHLNIELYKQKESRGRWNSYSKRNSYFLFGFILQLIDYLFFIFTDGFDIYGLPSSLQPLQLMVSTIYMCKKV